jgi:hypothetical protein
MGRSSRSLRTSSTTLTTRNACSPNSLKYCPPGLPLRLRVYPDGPLAEEPPLDLRLTPHRLRDWLQDTGFKADRTVDFENESYAFVCRCTAEDSGP